MDLTHENEKKTKHPHKWRFDQRESELSKSSRHVYVYQHMCVCVCVCMCMYMAMMSLKNTSLGGNHGWIPCNPRNRMAREGIKLWRARASNYHVWQNSPTQPRSAQRYEFQHTKGWESSQ